MVAYFWYAYDTAGAMEYELPNWLSMSLNARHTKKQQQQQHHHQNFDNMREARSRDYLSRNETSNSRRQINTAKTN